MNDENRADRPDENGASGAESHPRGTLDQTPPFDSPGDMGTFGGG